MGLFSFRIDPSTTDNLHEFRVRLGGIPAFRVPVQGGLTSGELRSEVHKVKQLYEST